MLKPILVAAALAATALARVGPADASVLDRIAEARLTAEDPSVSGPTLTKHFLTIAPGERVAVKGERERRQVRMARWIEGLGGDRAAVFARCGMPPFRHLELTAGRTLEFWSYPDARVTWVFCGDRLVRRTSF